MRGLPVIPRPAHPRRCPHCKRVAEEGSYCLGPPHRPHPAWRLGREQDR